MRHTKLPFEVKIEKPCTQSWHEMTGTAAERHCECCRKQVHNFAEMTPRQIERLVIATGGRLCAKLTNRQDGSLVTRNFGESPRYAAMALSATLALVPTAAMAQAKSPANPSLAKPTDGPDAIAPVQQNQVVSGTISDSQGALLAGSTVTITHEGAALGTTETNESGLFAFVLPPGEYQLQIASPGFAPVAKSLTVGSERAEASNVSLAPGSSISVTITASTTVDSTTIGELVASYGPWYKRLGYRLRHPVAYTQYLFRNR